jgi:hypothetical protein
MNVEAYTIKKLTKEYEMNKKIFIPILVGLIILVAGSAVGGFYFGKSYESNQANIARSDFFQQRGIQDTGQSAPPGLGGTVAGEVKSFDGTTLTLTSGDTETAITLSDTVEILKNTTSTSAELGVGQQVMVSGERDADGNIATATQVTILDANAAQPPVGTAP